MNQRRALIAFFLIAMLGAGAPSLMAQDSIAEDLRQQWAASRRQMVSIAEAMPADKYGYRPTSEVRTFGEILAHIAGEGRMEMEAVAGDPLGDSDRYESLSSRAEIVRVLSEFFDYGTSVLADVSNDQAFEPVTLRNRERPRWLVVMLAIGHNKEHYGNLVTYLRMNDLVPPASQ